MDPEIGESPPRYLTVVLPAFNEGAHIRACIHRLMQVLTETFGDDFFVLVINDGSTDRTESIVEGCGFPNIRVCSLTENSGKGFALRYGFTRSASTLTAQLDADLDLDPRALVGLVRIIENANADIAIGSKMHQESIVNYPRFRRLQSGVYRQLTKKLLRLEVSDTQTGIKVYRTESLHRLLPHLREQGFALDLEILSIARREGMEIVEGPVALDFSFNSTVRPSDVVRILMSTVRIWWRVGRRNRLADVDI